MQVKKYLSFLILSKFRYIHSEDLSLERPGGTLSFVQVSKSLSHVVRNRFGSRGAADESGSALPELPMRHVYRVVHPRGVTVYSDCSDQSPVVMEVPEGTNVYVARISIGTRWALVSFPCAGWCQMYVYSHPDELTVVTAAAPSDLPLGSKREGELIKNKAKSRRKDSKDSKPSTRTAAKPKGSRRAAPDAIDKEGQLPAQTLYPVLDIMFNAHGSSRPAGASIESHLNPTFVFHTTDCVCFARD
jgi:hypothetical protein